MFIKHLELKHFRCFAHKIVAFESDVVVIQGCNGSGKTSLLEAIHYSCYLRSFRTHSPKELLQFQQENFSIRVSFAGETEDLALKHQLHIGYADKKRLVKLNDKAVDSYKELMDYFRVVTVTEDDLNIIKLGPDTRRDFFDQAILLYDASYLSLLKEYKTILESRNRILQSPVVNKDMYLIWSEQLWFKSAVIQAARKEFMHLLQQEVDSLIKTYIPYDASLIFSYNAKYSLGSSFEDMCSKKDLFGLEKRFGRSLFGAHLDDIQITFQGTMSRMFASRGQQKLILLLIKIAQLRILAARRGAGAFLIDDFMTDFDQQRIEIALHALAGLSGQKIFTIPAAIPLLTQGFNNMGGQLVSLSG